MFHVGGETGVFWELVENAKNNPITSSLLFLLSLGYWIGYHALVAYLEIKNDREKKAVTHNHNYLILHQMFGMELKKGYISMPCVTFPIFQTLRTNPVLGVLFGINIGLLITVFSQWARPVHVVGSVIMLLISDYLNDAIYSALSKRYVDENMSLPNSKKLSLSSHVVCKAVSLNNLFRSVWYGVLILYVIEWVSSGGQDSRIYWHKKWALKRWAPISQRILEVMSAMFASTRYGRCLAQDDDSQTRSDVLSGRAHAKP
ncbi:hypothetical protein AAMO2058_000684200 [Amorphochlora amoebiformis]